MEDQEQATEPTPPPKEESGGPSAAPAPTKRLPSTRVAFSNQLDALRAVAAASGPDRSPVKPAAVGELIGLAASTVQLTVPFFVEIGLVERKDGGIAPSEEVVSFQEAHQWEAEHPTHELAPLLRETWFAHALTPKLSFGPISEKEALALLAREARAGQSHRAALRVLLEYLEVAGVISREGGMIRPADTRHTAPEAVPVVSPQQAPSAGAEPPVRSTPETTAFSHPLIRGLFQELPPPGSRWPKDKHDAWLELAQVAFRMVYTVDPGNREVQPPSYLEPPRGDPD